MLENLSIKLLTIVAWSLSFVLKVKSQKSVGKGRVHRLIVENLK